MISGIVVTHNSQDQLFDCLESLQDLVQEIVIVDLDSDDATKEIALKFKAKIIGHKFVPFVELVRQFAINQASGEWIILLDPDERLTSALINKLKNLNEDIVAVNIPRKNIFFGQWVRHTNFWPDKQIRFFNKHKVEWPAIIHAYPKVDGKILDLAAGVEIAIEHFGYQDYAEFFERQNRYSTAAATGQFHYYKLVWQPLREFLVRFIKHRGFLDGFLGLSLVYSLMIYQLMIQVKLWEKTGNS